MHNKFFRQKNVILLPILFLLTLSAGQLAATPLAQDHNRPQDLKTCSIFYQKYEPAFYTGFAPRSRDPKRLHLHVGRGNQLRATLVLSEEVLEAYVRDLLARYTTYQDKINDGSLQLTQNKGFETFAAVIKDKEIAQLTAVEEKMSRENIIRRNLLLMTVLNPGRVFQISLPVQKVIDHWLAFLQPADFSKPDRRRRLALINELLPTRLWLTSLDKATRQELSDLLQLAADNSEQAVLSKSYLALLDRITAGRYPRKGQEFSFVEFTAVYPIGTFNGYATCKGKKIPMYPTPGKWTLTTHQRSKTVDHIPEISIYSWFPWIPYMHVGKKLHNSFHTLWWRMEHAKTDFLPEELKNPQLKSREGKAYRYIWLLSRGPMSHGCTHVNGGHILELRQLLPADSEKIYDVVFYLNKSCLFDVFDIDGDLTPEVMGVRYFTAYTLKNKKAGKLRAPMERRPFYSWLYGGILKYEENGQGYFENIEDGRFVEKQAVAGQLYSRIKLYEAEMEPFRLQFFKMKSIKEIPGVRKLRQAGDDQPVKPAGKEK
jgi:hypothetical protein